MMGGQPVVVPEAQPRSRFQRAVASTSDHAEMLVSGLFAISLIIWICLIPRPQRPYVDTQLEQLASKSGPSQSTYQQDLNVWTRYEEDLAHYKWGVDLNLFLYSSLKTVAILLSAITPALIVAPSLKDKKVLAALPAVIVAVATGLIGEFDFKDEAARFDTAMVRLQTEKSLYITGGGPFYSLELTPCAESSDTRENGLISSPVSSSDCKTRPLSLMPDAADAPFAPPQSPADTRANFAYRIEKIRQAVASERDQFLRGKSQETAGEARPAPTAPKSSAPKAR